MGHAHSIKENPSQAFGIAALSAAVGAVVAMLFTPKSGRQLRHDIADKTNDAKDTVADKISSAKDTVQDKTSDLVDSAQEKTADMADEAKDKTGR